MSVAKGRKVHTKASIKKMLATRRRNQKVKKQMEFIDLPVIRKPPIKIEQPFVQKPPNPELDVIAGLIVCVARFIKS